MAKLILSAALLAMTAHTAYADEDVGAVAAEAGVDRTDLAGAVNTTQMDPRTYLVSVGELAAPEPAVPFNARVACIIRRESGGNPNAVNRSSGASGLGQFLASTWRTTPQGRAGYSVFDPDANRAAIQYMLDSGRAREFVAVQLGC